MPASQPGSSPASVQRGWCINLHQLCSAPQGQVKSQGGMGRMANLCKACMSLAEGQAAVRDMGQQDKALTGQPM